MFFSENEQDYIYTYNTDIYTYSETNKYTCLKCNILLSPLVLRFWILTTSHLAVLPASKLYQLPVKTPLNPTLAGWNISTLHEYCPDPRCKKQPFLKPSAVN